VLVIAGRLHALRAAVWLLLFWVSLHDVWDPAPRVVGGGPWSTSVKTLSVTPEDASGESRL
jgi:predicted acyltransferase